MIVTGDVEQNIADIIFMEKYGHRHVNVIDRIMKSYQECKDAAAQIIRILPSDRGTWDEGFNDGYAEGYADGEAAGREDGYEKGYEDGIEGGR